MVLRASHLALALLIAAAQLSPIAPARVIMAGVERIPGGLSADAPCLDQLAHVTRFDISVAILCCIAFALMARRVVHFALPTAELGLGSISLLGLAGFVFALAGCCRAFGWHPCSEIVGVGGICGATAILFVLAGAFVKCSFMSARTRRQRFAT